MRITTGSDKLTAGDMYDMIGDIMTDDPEDPFRRLIEQVESEEKKISTIIEIFQEAIERAREENIGEQTIVNALTTILLRQSIQAQGTLVTISLLGQAVAEIALKGPAIEQFVKTDSRYIQ